MTWPTVALGDCGDIQGGLQVSSKRTGLPISRPYLRVANVHRGRLDLSEIKTIDATPAEADRTELRRGDLLFVEGHANPQEVGRVAVWDGCIPRCVHQNHLIRFRPDAGILLPQFAARWFNAPAGARHFQRAGKTTSGLNTISASTVRSAPILLPPLDEQRRAAAILDRADALREKRRRIVAQFDELVEAVFNSAFGTSLLNPTTSLGEIADVASGITKGRKTAEPTRTIPYLAVANVQAGYLNLAQVKQIEATDREIERYALAAGDIVLTEGGDPDKLGRGTVWREELPFCLHQNHIFRVRMRDGRLHPEYLSAYLASRPAKSYFLRSAKQTTGIASINMTQLRGTPIYVPSQRDQQRYIDCVREIDSLRLTAAAEAGSLDELFGSVQSRAFAGQL